MLVRDARRLVVFIAPVLLLVIFGLRLYYSPGSFPANVKAWVPSRFSKTFADDKESPPNNGTPPADIPEPQTTPGHDLVDPEVHQDAAPDDALFSPEAGSTYQEIFSLSTKDRKYFLIDFGEDQALNPNIIPHPTIENTWIVVAQWLKEDASSPWFTELVCNAEFQDDVLRCMNAPIPLPVAATIGDRCEGDLAYFNSNIGPHDARVFFGPEKPYAVYGSNSMFTCFGQFVQDFRTLLDWKGDRENLTEFRTGTEIQRPLSWNTIEKNWFLFWDSSGNMYAHYDITPKRVFALLGSDGSAGPDLAPLAQASDEKCMAKYLPQLPPDLESIHQATNSLQITMCQRSDPQCVPDDSNTFIFIIYQHKTFYSYHSVYEPYVIVFRQQAPFEIHAMSRQPFWIHGRQRHPERSTSDMLYVTSMNWRQRDQRYHGYLDDELFLGFGIEDERAAGINLLAGNLLENLGLCNEL
ncbi:hypothetical protein FZEAL_645 [Fusarium zealandicum]|uniref:Uncharacterized protein n=1 Tax=Fusarium zealandicum TaxID=1053134 RepID=A0A8H4UV05_9HYPO|nr:hypothetical protein FZEAL_645 [Fusarium zealandicum]